MGGGKSFVRRVGAPTKMPPIIMLYCSHTLGYPTSALLINNAIQDPIGGIKFCRVREAQKKLLLGKNCPKTKKVPYFEVKLCIMLTPPPCS